MRRRKGRPSQTATAWNGSSASVSAPIVAKTEMSRSIDVWRRRVERRTVSPRPARGQRASAEVAAEHQRIRGCRAAARIIGGPAADVAEARAFVQPPRRRIVLVDLEEDRARAEAGEPAQMQVEQLARKPASAPRGGDRD